MKAMILPQIVNMSENPEPLRIAEIPKPVADEQELLIRISMCGVCHTELDEIEGRTAPEKLPVVPGHQVVGFVETETKNLNGIKKGDRVGVAWIHSACGNCDHCRRGDENLCAKFTATGRDVNGGYAEYMTVPASFACPIPDGLTDEEAAPLLCAGAIGYRSLSLTNISNGDRLGMTGFGASGHLVLRMARKIYPDSEIFVFARSVDQRKFAKKLGASWAGDTVEKSPKKLHAIIDTTPVWKPVVEAMENLEPGGRLVINAIRKKDVDQDYLLNIKYSEHLWMEKEIKSVANVTRKDVNDMLRMAADFNIKPDVETYPLEKANQALMDIKLGGSRGAKVLTIT